MQERTAKLAAGLLAFGLAWAAMSASLRGGDRPEPPGPTDGWASCTSRWIPADASGEQPVRLRVEARIERALPSPVEVQLRLGGAPASAEANVVGALPRPWVSGESVSLELEAAPSVGRVLAIDAVGLPAAHAGGAELFARAGGRGDLGLICGPLPGPGDPGLPP